MEGPKDSDGKLNRLAMLSHAYGAQLSVFVPPQQSAPTKWGPVAPESDDKAWSILIT
jgi:hypothetical protein